jgi:hypothetical protein
MADDDGRDIHWSNQLEDIMAKEGEKCRGLAWIHQKAEQSTSRKNTCISLPVIILSTLAGTASVGSTSLFAGNQATASIVIGLVSISVGIMNTVSSFFAFARKSEAHHIAFLHYSKLFSWVAVEMALPRNERMPPELMLKTLREAMERLAETTPSPEPEILEQFRQTFSDKTDGICRPPETNGLEKIAIYRAKHHPVTPSQVGAERSPEVASLVIAVPDEGTGIA